MSWSSKFPAENELKIAEINIKILVIFYSQETYKFCMLVQNTMPMVCKLLTSKAASDVVEAIQFVINSKYPANHCLIPLMVYTSEF